MNSLGERVRQAREYRGVNQTDLGRAVGLSQQAISKIEAGTTAQPGPVVAIAVALRVRPEWLALGEEPMEAEPTSAATRLAARIAASDARTQQLIELALLNPTDPIPEGLSPSIRQLLDVVRSMIPDAPHG